MYLSGPITDQTFKQLFESWYEDLRTFCLKTLGDNNEDLKKKAQIIKSTLDNTLVYLLRMECEIEV